VSRSNRKSAAALAYEDHRMDGPPRVVAKGYGLVAEMIVQRAKEAGLYVHEAPEMVSLLMQVDLDARIPPQLYQAVAELLAWLHRLESGAADDQFDAEDDAPDAAPGAGAADDPPDPALPGGPIPPTRWLK
jgi:flagellar biosynthesis protein